MTEDWTIPAHQDVRKVMIRIREQIVDDGYFSEAVIADGPWEARFRFCGEHGCNPADVSVDPTIRVPNGSYWCSIGTPKQSGFLSVRPDYWGESCSKSTANTSPTRR